MTEAPRPVRVLILDDESAIVRLCRRVVGAFTTEIATAGRVAEAEALVASRGFDVLITDVRLPDGSGLDLAARFLKADPRRRVLVLTGSLLPERGLTEEGPRQRLLVKPFEIDEFRSVVAAILAGPEGAR